MTTPSYYINISHSYGLLFVTRDRVKHYTFTFLFLLNVNFPNTLGLEGFFFNFLDGIWLSPIVLLVCRCNYVTCKVDGKIDLLYMAKD